MGQNRNRSGGEGSFCMSFQQTSDALEWCMEAQQELVKVDWPKGLLDHPGAAEEWGDTDDRLIYNGLRVRMGVHVGRPHVVRDPMTRRVEYIGPVVNAAARITAMTHGGQILMSETAFCKVEDTELASKEGQQVVCLGRFEMPDCPQGAATNCKRINVPHILTLARTHIHTHTHTHRS
jgi:class 3 adenylate cyclase